MKYYYPPRVENKIESSSINNWENKGFIAQAKMNGSCGVVFTKEKEIWNRHNEKLSNFEYNLNFLEKDCVLVGEYMNKSKLDINNKNSNTNLYLFDIIVYDNKPLLNWTFEKRRTLLESLIEFEDNDILSFKSKENNKILLLKNYESNFEQLYQEFSKYDFCEGLVLKRKNSILEPGYRELNNSSWQIKCRKKTKNYKF